MTVHDERASETLLHGNWPRLHTLDLSRIRLCRRFFERVVQGNWRLQLKHLSLAHTSLDLAAISHLVHFQAQLESLDIGHNKMPPECMKVLSQGRWQHLKHLNCGGCKLDREAFEYLLQANWPILQSLKIVNPPTYTMHRELGEDGSCLREAGNLASTCSRKWRYLTVLDLTSLKLTVAMLNQLAQGRWSSLRRSCLPRYDLDASAACHVLLRGNWPVLQEFIAAQNKLQAVDVSQLIECYWPRLKLLDLSNNQLEEHAVTCLADGSWPLLAKLSLKGNCEVEHRRH